MTLHLYMILTCFFFSAEDEVAAAHITSRNALESYAYNLRYTLFNDDMTKLEVAVNDTIKWLVASQEVSKQEYEEKQKELEAIAKYVSLFFLGFGLVIHALVLAL